MTHKTTSTIYNQTKQTDKIWKKNNQQPFFVGENVKNMKRNKQNRHFC